MADLSFLFQKPQAQGIGAGYELGMNDYMEQQKLQQNQAYANQAQAQADKMKAMMPFDIEKAQYEQGRGRQLTEDASIAETGFKKYQTQNGQFELMQKYGKQIQGQTAEYFMPYYEKALGGASGEQLYQSMRNDAVQMIQNAPEELRPQLQQKIMQMEQDPTLQSIRGMQGGQAAQAIRGFIEKMHGATLDSYLEQMRADSAMKRTIAGKGDRGQAGKEYDDFIQSYMQSHQNSDRNTAHEAWLRARYGQALAPKVETKSKEYLINGVWVPEENLTQQQMSDVNDGMYRSRRAKITERGSGSGGTPAAQQRQPTISNW